MKTYKELNESLAAQGAKNVAKKALRTAGKVGLAGALAGGAALTISPELRSDVDAVTDKVPGAREVKNVGKRGKREFDNMYSLLKSTSVSS